MRDKSFTDVDIRSVTESFRNHGIPEDIISIATEDMEKGIPKEKIMIYASAGGDIGKVKSMSKALQLGASERVVQKIGVLDKYKNELIIRELEFGVPDDVIFSIISKKQDVHAMDQMFKRYRDNMANTVPAEPEKDDAKKDKTADDISNDKGHNDASEYDHKVYIKSEEIVDALGPVIKQISEQMMQQLTQVITPAIAAAIPKPAVETPEVVAEADRTIIKEESSRPRMVFVDMEDSKDANKDNQNTVIKNSETNNKAVQTLESSVMKETDSDNSASTGNASNVIDLNSDYHMYLTTPDGRSVPVHVDQTKPKKPKNVISIAERFFKGTPSQKSLLRMLIDGRLSPDQLRQIQRAKEANFSDMELKDLIECGLPAEEMSGIIDVVMADKKLAV